MTGARAARLRGTDPRSRTLTRRLAESFVVAVVATSASYLVGLLVGWVTPEGVNGWEAFAVATSYACTYLCVHERRINYPIGAISSAAYAYVFAGGGLLASAVLNAYLVPTLVYGWLRWRPDAVGRPVTRVRPAWIPVYLVVTGAGWAGAALLSDRLGGSMAPADAVILAGTILAQFLLDNKKLETWVVWAVVNVFAIYTYAASGLGLVALQYVFFLGNTIYGHATWRTSWRETQRRSMAGDGVRTDDGDAADDRSSAAGGVRLAGG